MVVLTDTHDKENPLGAAKGVRSGPIRQQVGRTSLGASGSGQGRPRASTAPTRSLGFLWPAALYTRPHALAQLAVGCPPQAVCEAPALTGAAAMEQPLTGSGRVPLGVVNRGAVLGQAQLGSAGKSRPGPLNFTQYHTG